MLHLGKFLGPEGDFVR